LLARRRPIDSGGNAPAGPQRTEWGGPDLGSRFDGVEVGESEAWGKEGGWRSGDRSTATGQWRCPEGRRVRVGPTAFPGRGEGGADGGPSGDHSPADRRPPNEARPRGRVRSFGRRYREGVDGWRRTFGLPGGRVALEGAGQEAAEGGERRVELRVRHLTTGEICEPMGFVTKNSSSGGVCGRRRSDWSGTSQKPFYLSIYLSIYLSTYLSTYLSSYPRSLGEASWRHGTRCGCRR